MTECDKINSYNALVSANHVESFITQPEKPKTVAHTMNEQVKKNKASKEAERVISTGYSSSPVINSKLNSNYNYNKNTPSSGYSGGNSQSYYNSSYGKGYGSNPYNQGYASNNNYRGNNLDYNSRISNIRQKAKETAANQKKYEKSRGAGLVDFEGKYSFSIKNGKVKHHTGRNKNKITKIFNKNVAKQAVVAVGVIIFESALAMAMTEAKNGISSIGNEIKKSLVCKSK